MSWKLRMGVAAAVVSMLAMGAARADDPEGPWEVRLRADYLAFAQKSDAIPSLAVPSDAIHVNDKWLPDLDLEYFFASNWSSELVLTYPQLQRVTVEKSALGGPTAIGTFRHLPPTLTVKYDFLPDQVFRPYVGVGINLTLISDVNLNVPVVNVPLRLDNHSVGFAGQAGFDWQLAPHWYANADVKWIQLSSDVKLNNGTKVTEVRLDPWLLGIGVGYRF
jgi:outer membrane protein